MNARQNTTTRAANAGFTLVEIMIVVGIIGTLCAVAIPSFAKSRQTARVDRMVNDLRIAYDAINMYAMEHGSYPNGGWQDFGSSPVAVSQYIKGSKWATPTVLGGNWYYYSGMRFDTVSGTMKPWYLLLVYTLGSSGTPVASAADWRKVDEKIDDGNLSTGTFKFVANVQVQYSFDDVAW